MTARTPCLWTPIRCGLAHCILVGMNERNAAAALGVSPKSVQRHSAALKRYLGAMNRTHLAAILGQIASQP